MDKLKNSYKILLLFILCCFYENSFSQSIFITKLSDLDFGDVFIGTLNVDVAHTDAGAAKLSFYHDKGGKKGSKLNVSFTLPSNLANLLQLLSPLTHFDNVARGLIDLRDILYFISLIFTI